MKILGALTKKLFTFRKIMWLFLCGMLVISEEAVAQDALGDKGAADTVRPPATEQVVKYGPPSSAWPVPQKGQPSKKNTTKAAKERAEKKRQLEIQKREMIKYGPASTVKPPVQN